MKFNDEWFKASESSNNFMSIILYDFSRSFDFINHNVLLLKFLDHNFPPLISVWSLVFLQDREQFVSVGNTNSTVLKSGSAGNYCRTNDFKLLINDLLFDINNTLLTSQCSQSQLISTDPNDFSLQSATVHSCLWSACQKRHAYNEKKTKEKCNKFWKKIVRNSVPSITADVKTI